MNKLNVLEKQYPLYNNFIKGYFTEIKLKYFMNESFNYNKFPKDIRSNSILERYNKTIKEEMGQKSSGLPRCSSGMECIRRNCRGLVCSKNIHRSTFSKSPFL